MQLTKIRRKARVVKKKFHEIWKIAVDLGRFGEDGVRPARSTATRTCSARHCATGRGRRRCGCGAGAAHARGGAERQETRRRRARQRAAGRRANERREEQRIAGKTRSKRRGGRIDKRQAERAACGRRNELTHSVRSEKRINAQREAEPRDAKSRILRIPSTFPKTWMKSGVCDFSGGDIRRIRRIPSIFRHPKVASA